MNRRDFLWRSGGGLGGIALADLLLRDPLHAQDTTPMPRADLNGGLHHRAKAKRVIQLFMSGAISQLDTFDYKLKLIAKSGEPWDPGEKVELFQSVPGKTMKSPWNWRQHGKCGKFVSDLVPHLAERVDDICFVHSMTSKTNVHGSATFLQTTGFSVPGFPSSGAWISYGLGSMNESLPAFVVLPDHRGYPPGGLKNWSSGFLPARHQGVMIKPSARNPIADLFPPTGRPAITPEGEAENLALLQKLNREHQRTRESDSRLDARIASYELAARLQTTAPEVLDISKESAATRKLYGIDEAPTADFGRNCLIARRLLERGVRFVQLWSGADNGFPRRNWDSHEDLARDHGSMALGMDRPAAALLLDLKSRGMLDDTIVYFTTDFGRMPCSQGSLGRDHNPFGFTCWLAGGGIKGGTSYGSTDEWSYKAVDKPTDCYDIHATILHQLGIDHTRLTFRQSGLDRRLTDVHGHILRDIIS